MATRTTCDVCGLVISASRMARAEIQVLENGEGRPPQFIEDVCVTCAEDVPAAIRRLREMPQIVHTRPIVHPAVTHPTMLPLADVNGEEPRERPYDPMSPRAGTTW